MTKTLIVDASAADAWLLASQTTPSALALLEQLDAWRLAAPYVFHWEMMNLLVRQARRDPGFDLSEAFERLADFEIEVEPAPDAATIRRLAHLAAANGLSLFDVSYLWLTLAADGTLASRDGTLLDAARAAGQPVLDLRSD